MEMKQLEYFVMTADQGSLNRAAEQLYTSQPNVSKVIAGLEKELGAPLFERSNKGISLTPQGELLYGHAMTILKHSNVIRSMITRQVSHKFSVSGYQSSLLTKLMAEAYNNRGDKDLKYEYREGTVEGITNDVSERISEIGIVYLAESQLHCFKHIIEHKKLDFYPLAQRGICIYVGSSHPLYHRDSIGFSELKNLKFVEGTDDFFAMEHHLERISIGAVHMENMNNVFFTNSDYMLNNLLLHTDVCCMGIDFVASEYEKYEIKALKVNDCEKFLTLGFVKLNGGILSTEAKWYIKKLRKILEETRKI